MISISSCRHLCFWNSRARAKALLLVFKETLKKDEVSNMITDGEHNIRIQNIDNTEMCWNEWEDRLLILFLIFDAADSCVETGLGPIFFKWNMARRIHCWVSDEFGDLKYEILIIKIHIDTNLFKVVISYRTAIHITWKQIDSQSIEVIILTNLCQIVIYDSLWRLTGLEM